ncbi:MAG: hypothetical protein V3R78_07135, partial [Thermodesulfobacteriota bacterium]
MVKKCFFIAVFLLSFSTAASANITLFTFAEAHTAIFNTPVERETIHDGWKTIAYRKTRPMPSYLLAIASGRLDSVPIPGMSIPGRLYT